MINKEKPDVLFSANTGDEGRGEVKHILGVQKETMTDRYLSLPVNVGKAKTKVFYYLKDHVWQRI